MRPMLAALGLLLAPTAVPAQQAERFTLAGSDVQVYNLAGDAVIEAGTGSAVVVEVSRGGADAARLTVDQASGRLVVRYPGDRVRYGMLGRGSSTQIRIRDDGTFLDQVRDGRRVTISGDRGLEAWADLRILVPAGRTVAVHVAVGQVVARNVAGDLTVRTAAADVVTERTRGDLLVDVGSGNVRVTGAEGDLLVDTGSGDVTLSGIRGSRLTFDTGSGDVEGNDLSGTELTVDTGSGSINLAGVTADRVMLDTGSGDVDVVLDRDVAELSADTGSGNVTIRAPADLGATLDIDTGSGDIETEMPITLTRRARDHLTGRIGDGQGRIVIETGSGDVRLLAAGS